MTILPVLEYAAHFGVGSLNDVPYEATRTCPMDTIPLDVRRSRHWAFVGSGNEAGTWNAARQAIAANHPVTLGCMVRPDMRWPKVRGYEADPGGAYLGAHAVLAISCRWRIPGARRGASMGWPGWGCGLLRASVMRRGRSGRVRRTTWQAQCGQGSTSA
jgi:hypothetical protein